MITHFDNSLDYAYLIMGNSTEYFFDVVITKRIEQGIRVGRLLKPTENKGFARRRKDAKVSNVEKEYKSKKNYQTKSYQNLSSQISSIKFVKSVERGIYASRHGPKNYKAYGRKNPYDKLPILH